MKIRHILSGLLILLLVCGLFCSCGSSVNTSNSSQHYDIVEGSNGMQGGVDIKYPSADITDSSAELSREEFEEKLIKTVRMQVETKEYDKAIRALDDAITVTGGYIESSSASGRSLNYTGDYYRRSASYVIRIPSGRLGEFLSEAQSIFNVVYSSTGEENVTSQYYDIQVRIGVLESERESLQDMLEKASDVKTMLEIRQRLYEVIYEIESYQTKLKMYDSLVSYATVYIDVDEVVEYTRIVEEETWGERLAVAFVESWQNFAEGFQDFTVGLLYAFPTLLVLAVIVGIVLAVVLLINKKMAKKRKNGQGRKSATASASREDWRRPIDHSTDDPANTDPSEK